MLPRKNLIGQKYATLTVVEYIGKKNKNNYWKCQCDCGEVVTLPTSNLQSRHLRSCGCLRAKIGSKHKNWKGCGDIPASYLCKIKGHAKMRGIEFNLTVEHLWHLFLAQKGNCALSGEKLTYPQSFRALSTGEGNASLDRIDSAKGYEVGNVQWVDKKINFMKQQFGQEEFISLCRIIVRHQDMKEIKL